MGSDFRSYDLTTKPYPSLRSPAVAPMQAEGGAARGAHA